MSRSTPAEFEVKDWDTSTRVLSGLDMATQSSEARKAVELGFFVPYPDIQIQTGLKSIAVQIFNHQKITDLFLTNVSATRAHLVVQHH